MCLLRAEVHDGGEPSPTEHHLHIRGLERATQMLRTYMRELQSMQKA